MPAWGQKNDTSGKVKIHILNNKFVTFTHTDTAEFYRFVGDVVMQQGTDTLYCDTLLENKTSNIIEAFGHVKMAQQDGTQGTSDYLRYTSENKQAYMHGNVSLTDGKNNLQSEDLTYDLGAKQGHYFNHGTLHNDSTTVVSDEGVYNGHTKDARFTGHAVITDPEYKIHSEDLEYNTETRVTRFYARSTVISDSGKSILQTTNGTYDGKKGIAHFLGHSSIWNDGEYIEGDSLDYNKLTGYGLGNGNVIVIDTAHHSRLYCGHTEYFHKKRVLWATIKPVLEQVNGKDTFYMRGDTMYSAPMEKVKLAPAKLKLPTGKEDSGRLANAAPDSDTTVKWEGVAAGKENSKGADTTKPATDTNARKPLGPIFDRDVYAVKQAMKIATLDSVTNKNRPAEKPGMHARDTATAEIKGKAKISQADTAKGKIVKKKPQPDFYWRVPEGPKYRKPETMQVQMPAENIAAKPKAEKHRKGKKFAKSVADTVSADTTAPMYFVAWNHVLLFSDSMQGKCDSICYTRSDSMIRMINEPIAWAHKSQITGDTILLQLDSSEIRRMYVPNNAFVVSQSGPEKAEMFDQVQGRTLTAWFTHNEIDHMLVVPDAECIYYSKDEHDAYMGVDQGKSVRMLVYFEDQKIVNIKFHQDVHQTVTPMEKADIPNTKLSRFKWLIDERPKSKEELFR
jgi:lipopolysaccharide transport protein LptA